MTNNANCKLQWMEGSSFRVAKPVILFKGYSDAEVVGLSTKSLRVGNPILEANSCLFFDFSEFEFDDGLKLMTTEECNMLWDYSRYYERYADDEMNGYQEANDFYLRHKLDRATYMARRISWLEVWAKLVENGWEKVEMSTTSCTLYGKGGIMANYVDSIPQVLQRVVQEKQQEQLEASRAINSGGRSRPSKGKRKSIASSEKLVTQNKVQRKSTPLQERKEMVVSEVSNPEDSATECGSGVAPLVLLKDLYKPLRKLGYIIAYPIGGIDGVGYQYTFPGKSKKGELNVDFVYGDDAMAQILVEQGILAVSDEPKQFYYVKPLIDDEAEETPNQSNTQQPNLPTENEADTFSSLGDKNLTKNVQMEDYSESEAEDDREMFQLKEIYTILKANGWSILNPVGLSLNYRYVLPGCSKTGEEGKDYFEGDDTIIQYLLKNEVIAKAEEEKLFYVDLLKLKENTAAALKISNRSESKKLAASKSDSINMDVSNVARKMELDDVAMDHQDRVEEIFTAPEMASTEVPMDKENVPETVRTEAATEKSFQSENETPQKDIEASVTALPMLRSKNQIESSEM